MALDTSQFQLPPPGARLRLPPTNTRKPTYAEVCQITRQHPSELDARVQRRQRGETPSHSREEVKAHIQKLLV
jgi:hypothetical protein